MSSLKFETEEMRPVKAWCSNDAVHIELADGRSVSAPLAWYPFLAGSTDQQLNTIELMFEGIWWDHVDEGISVKSIFMGWKAPGAPDEPLQAAE
ncbi:MAG: DUF2442 domain-containing protein [Pseudomonadota bacterium]